MNNDSSLQSSKEFESEDDDEHLDEADDRNHTSPRQGTVPTGVNFSMNIVITFALSLSIYLLMANVFLTFNKISNLQWNKNGLPLAFVSDAGMLDRVLSDGSGARGAVDKTYQYYDCSKSLLTIEECDLLNSYHDEYLNSLRSYLTRQSNGNEQHKLQNSLKVNTSFFIH